MFDLSKLEFLGESLSRPECAIAHSSGHVFVPNCTASGGVSIIAPSGATSHVLVKRWQGEDGAKWQTENLRPNGIALLQDGSFLLAHLGDEHGGIFKFDIEGTAEPFVTEVDGTPLPPCNYVYSDRPGRTWASVSTRHIPRASAYRSDIQDGFILVTDEKGTRVVADGLGYTNECAIHPDGNQLYVNETFSKRLSAFELSKDGSLSNRRTITEFGEGIFPDGLAFDVEGNAWITSIVSNRVVRIDAQGNQQVWLDDSDPDHLNIVEQAWHTQQMGRSHLDNVQSEYLKNISNLAFGGPDLRTGYLGCLLDDRIAKIEMPVAGHPLSHWNADIGRILTKLNSRKSQYK